MSRKLLKFFSSVLLIMIAISVCYSVKYLRDVQRKNFSLLIDFTCAVAKDELEKNPEMQTIAMVELENNFPADFSAKVQKCLPKNVAKVILNPHTFINRNSSLLLPKQTMVIFVADKVEEIETFYKRAKDKPDDKFYKTNFHDNLPVVHHLSKHLIVSSDKTKIKGRIFNLLLNVVQIYEENRKVIARSFDMRRNLPNFETFESSQRENLSRILFPDKAKNLKGQKLLVNWLHSPIEIYSSGYSGKPISMWTPYFDIIEEKLNATVVYAIDDEKNMYVTKKGNILDFLSGAYTMYSDLEAYNRKVRCLAVPLPKPFSITELILFLPLDEPCWKWLGITIAVSTLLWRISEGHWDFFFGAFSYFMGQAQLTVRIRTNRLSMKILLQLLIFTIFVFSNGYQSLVTSFMLNPVQEKLLKTLDDVLDSELKIEKNVETFLKNNPKYEKMEEDRFVNSYSEKNCKNESCQLTHMVDCKIRKFLIDNDGDGKSWLGFYMIPEVVSSYEGGLLPRPFHPYLDKFQELLDRTFEVGLPQSWERVYWKIWRNNIQRIQPEEENEILDFGLIAPFFLILAFGFSAALFALLCEIFYHDFVSEFSREYFKRKKEEIFKRRTGKAKLRKVLRGKVQKRKLKVKKIKVRPATV